MFFLNNFSYSIADNTIEGFVGLFNNMELAYWSDKICSSEGMRGWFFSDIKSGL
jgi:hypothetical protein